MRLIDADYLKTWFGEKDLYTYDYIIGTIDDAPTVKLEAKLLAEIKIDKEDLEELVSEKVGEMKEMIVDTGIHWIPCSERLPKNNVPVNITWVNRNPESYYADIKDQPFTATGVHYNNKWYWYSDTIEDVLAEYGRAEWYEIEESIEVIAWMPLPEPARLENV